MVRARPVQSVNYVAGFLDHYRRPSCPDCPVGETNGCEGELVAVGCALHHTLYAPDPGGSGLRALVLTAIGNGTLWLAFYTCFNTLPFRRAAAAATI